MNKKFELLEKKLNIANELMDELTFDDLEIEDIEDVENSTGTELQLIEPTNIELMPVNLEDGAIEIFSIEHLKTDFLMIRQQVQNLILSSQRTLNTVSLLDVADLKPAHLTAIASLQKTLGDNLELMVKLYRQIADIEKMRAKNKGNQAGGGTAVNNGTVVNNNIIYSGNTSDLLDFLKENEN